MTAGGRSAQPLASKPPATTIQPDHASRASPSGALSRRPQGRFYSTALTAASSSIQPTLPMPTTNIKSISAQQQPTQ